MVTTLIWQVQMLPDQAHAAGGAADGGAGAFHVPFRSELSAGVGGGAPTLTGRCTSDEALGTSLEPLYSFEPLSTPRTMVSFHSHKRPLQQKPPLPPAEGGAFPSSSVTLTGNLQLVACSL